MTGPEHYREAEDALETAAEEEIGSTGERYYLDKAQVHATLALAAATALGSLRADDHGMPATDGNDWIRTTSADTELIALTFTIDDQTTSTTTESNRA